MDLMHFEVLKKKTIWEGADSNNEQLVGQNILNMTKNWQVV